jgi:hypothetical protein
MKMNKFVIVSIGAVCFTYSILSFAEIPSDIITSGYFCGQLGTVATMFSLENGTQTKDPTGKILQITGKAAMRGNTIWGQPICDWLSLSGSNTGTYTMKDDGSFSVYIGGSCAGAGTWQASVNPPTPHLILFTIDSGDTGACARTKYNLQGN